MIHPHIGLEIHVQLSTKSKMFCACRAQFGDEANTNICPVCMGYPGVLPVMNREAIFMTYLLSSSLHCTVSSVVQFDRKNYFYPDLPKNYQITQFAQPIGKNGVFLLDEGSPEGKKIRITEVHLEEDAGKMIHGGDATFCDYNRAGVPLVEIVTEPDLHSGAEAEAMVMQMRNLVRYLAVCDGNMEGGSLRCDANISVSRQKDELGSKVEVKNLNSFRFIRQAVDHEIDRQGNLLKKNSPVVQETRLWNENRDITVSMREKEDTHDYRYFPEPDMRPYVVSEDFLRRVTEAQVELPRSRKIRLTTSYDLEEKQADFLVSEKETADFFEEAVSAGASAREVALWLMGDVQKYLRRFECSLQDSPLTPQRLASLIRMLHDGKIHGRIAKNVLQAVFSEHEDPEVIVEKRHWSVLQDPAELMPLIRTIIAEHPEVSQQFSEGHDSSLDYLIGRLMRHTEGRADPVVSRTLLKETLEQQKSI